MDEKTRQEKVRRFLMDEVMASAVHDIILKAFLKNPPGEDVNVLAAERIAINLLQQAWKDLERWGKLAEDVNSEKTQVGL